MGDNVGENVGEVGEEIVHSVPDIQNDDLSVLRFLVQGSVGVGCISIVEFVSNVDYSIIKRQNCQMNGHKYTENRL